MRYLLSNDRQITLISRVRQSSPCSLRDIGFSMADFRLDIRFALRREMVYWRHRDLLVFICVSQTERQRRH
jgi:hypothetical protein